MQSNFSDLPCFIQSGKDNKEIVHQYTLVHQECQTKIAYIFDNEYCPEVVSHLKYFLLAVGFAESTIMDGFARCLEEYEHAIKKNALSSRAD